MEKKTYAMPAAHQDGSIFRNLPLPRERDDLNSERLGTFRLRYVLAEDGCRESQLVLAKILLSNLSDISEERHFNAQLAVFWLLQAVKKGQNEAFKLLKDCSELDIGTSVINKSEIEKCLKFNEEERLARKVAYFIFRAIMSDTEDLVSEDVFRQNIDLIFKESKSNVSSTSEDLQKKDDESTLWNRPPQKKHDSPPLKKPDDKPSSKTTDDSPTHKITNEPILLQKPVFQTTTTETSLRSQAHVSFNEVVSSVQSCLEGNVPLVSLTQVTQCNAYKRWFSTKYLRLIWDVILRSAEKLIWNISSMVLLVSMLFLCILLQFVHNSFSLANETSNFIKKFSLIATTFLCLLTMISYTCFVLHINFGGDNFKKWLNLIKIFEPNVRSDDVEKKYVSKTTLPLTTFFFVSFMYMALIPLSMNPLTFADIGILSFILMLLIDRTIYQQRYYVNISLVLNALTCMYKTNLLQNIYTSSLSYFNFTIDYEITQSFYMHISFLSCLTLPFVLPYLYVKMTLGQKRGWHLVLLPHLMSLTWMNLACIHLVNVTSTYQLFSVFTWLVILLASKYIGTLFTLILYLLFKIADPFKIEVMALCIVFSVLYFVSSFFVKRFKVSPTSKFWSAFICLCIVILSYQSVKPGESSQSVFNEVMQWEKYQSHCHQHAWYRINAAEVQISCFLLKGKKISMEGTVTDIEIVEVHNNMELIANFLPQPLQSWFVCGLGKSFASCDSEGMAAFEKERCELYRSLNLNQCYLQNWDEYKYKIVLELSIRYSLEVELYADHRSSEFVKSLKEGDSLQVIGVLESNIGKNLPGFILKHAKCTTCYTDLLYTTSPSLSATPDYRLSLKNIVQLYLAPIIIYEPK